MSTQIPHKVSDARVALAGALAFALACCITSSLSAQGIAPKPAGPNTLIGVVTDTLGAPLENVDVSIARLRRRTRTRADGSFRFDSVVAGTYDVAARSVGLVAPQKRVVVGPDGGSVYIRMIRFGNILAPMVTTANMGGLSGTIADTAYRAMPGVKVQVIGAGQTAHTDSTGAFFLPLKPGQYMLRIERDGFVRQIAGVTIPENEGRRIAAWMVPQSRKPNPMQAIRLFDLNQRMMRVNPASSKFFAREQLQTLGIYDLQDLARRWATGRMAPDCMVSINGGQDRLPLSAISTSEIEFVELYMTSYATAGGSTRGVTSLNGLPTKHTTPTSMRPSTSSSCGNLGLVAWLRQ